ncbi:MAG: HU family DNA-binding protein [Candidatus Midichloria sp.]|nr:HU family DNA-binding protein [Candidatus Midichloria sp.]
MNKTEFIAAIATHNNSTKAEAARFVDSFISVVTETLQCGDEVRLVGFGSFKVKDVAARDTRNPQTGKIIKVPATKRPRFSAGKELKEVTNHCKK